MPQTEEHLAIVELLGVTRGIPVLTKRDLVDTDWLALVETEVADRLRESRVRWEAPIATSAVTGGGLEDLRAALRAVAQELETRSEVDLFRLPIDRVFAVAGAGTVVTGTTWSGAVAVGDSVHLLPLDRAARVRSIEVHGQAAARAVPGRRTALALVGVDRAELERGAVAVTGEGWAATRQLDAAVELLPSAARPIQPRTRLRVHLGTAEVLARATQTAPIVPGTQGRIRLALESPLVARGGDRFVLRSFSPVTTIGGGVVLDPFPPRRPALSTRRLDVAQAAEDRLSAWLAETGLAGLRTGDLAVRLGILPGNVSGIIAAAGKGVLNSSGWLVSRPVAAAEAERLAGVVQAHHERHPLDPGMSLQAVRATMGSPDVRIPEPIVNVVVDLAVRKQLLELEGGVAHRSGWKPVLDSTAHDARATLSRRIADARWQVPTASELEREFPTLPVRALLAHLLREGGVEQVDLERYAAPAALVEFRAALETALGELGSATPAGLRDRFGLTRKYLIPLLEWADRRGITERRGDARVLARLTGRNPGT
jgi:selenocysteine-specific elongation factor